MDACGWLSENDIREVGISIILKQTEMNTQLPISVVKAKEIVN